MKHIQRITILIFALVLVLFTGFVIKDRLFSDHTAPVLSSSADTLEISVHDDRGVLMEGMNAYDNRDGDLTDRIFITGVSSLITNDTAKVTYVVFDSSNNMATMSRTIRYTDYEKPEFALSKPLIYSVGETISLMDRLAASDLLDGDLSDKIRVTARSLSSQYEGVYSINVQVTNSLGDSSTLPLKVVVSNSGAGNQLISLTGYIVYLERGAEFNAGSYIASVHNPDGSSAAGSKVRIVSNVDTSAPGNYEVSYTYEASGQTYTAYMVVVVK